MFQHFYTPEHIKKIFKIKHNLKIIYKNYPVIYKKKSKLAGVF